MGPPLPRFDSGCVQQQSLNSRVDVLQPAKQRFLWNGGCASGNFAAAKASRLGHAEVENCVSRGDTETAREEVSWKNLSLHSTQWSDSRSGKQGALHPDFRHRTSKEWLRRSSLRKPAWVDMELSVRDAEMTGCTSTAQQDVPEASGEVRTLRQCCEQGELRDAVEALDILVQRGFHVKESLFYRILKKCTARKDLRLGRRVHGIVIKAGCESKAFVANHIIGMYAAHGRVEEAMRVFTKVPMPNAHIWASIVFALARNGQPREAVNLYRQMRRSTVQPDNHTYVAVLKACGTAGDIDSGKEVHADILENAVKVDTFLGNCIVDMYSKCGNLEEARRVFDKLQAKDVVTWTTMMAGYAQQGLGEEALGLYGSMQQEGISVPNHVTFVCLLQACASVRALHQGKELHAQIRERGLGADVFVGNSLVNMYSKCGSLDDARKVFDTLPRRDVVAWNAMIAGYAEHGLCQEALALYGSMQMEGAIPASPVTFVCLLQACANSGALHQGKQLHAQIRERGLEDNVVVGNSVLNMYAKCGSLEDARRLFDSLPTRDMVTWNTMIGGYAQHGLGQEALGVYARMQLESVIPGNEVTFVCLLQACTSIGALHQGKQLHAELGQRGLEADVAVGNCLVDMYAKCGKLEEARRVFDRLPTRDEVTWTVMLSGYAHEGLDQEALTLYESMQAEGLSPCNHTFACLLQSCASAGALQKGKRLHSQIQDRGLEADVLVGNCLVDMYAKCGSIEDARSVFDRLPTRNVVSWNSMIAGYAQHELGPEALILYARMREEGVTPADHTFVCLLKACASVGALGEGKSLHAEIQERGLEANMMIGNCVVDMYAKCGSLGDARLVFDRLPTRDVVTWTALMNGYAEHSDAEMAMQCFEDMQQQGVEPNDATFICLLVACSHAGLVSEGQRYFKMLWEDHGIEPTEQHYSCMVDLLARSGHLDEAETLVQTMPFANAVVGWTCLLSACKSLGDLERGRRCFERLVTLEPGTASSYVLLANMYANAGRWSDVDRIERLRKCSGAMKKAAKACIEVKSKVYEFRVGEERSHVSSKLRSMNVRLQQEGAHVPQTELVLKAVTECEKEDALCGHAEKLALAYGLLNTPEGTPLLVTKNLRMCNDCHSGTKVMSRLENREIVVRDAHRVHRFLNGACSCGDRR